jgi:hypothetical protein
LVTLIQYLKLRPNGFGFFYARMFMTSLTRNIYRHTRNSFRVTRERGYRSCPS